MSKGLEALAEMRKYGAVMIPNCEIIEKELKALEIIRKHVKLDKYKYESDETYGLTEYMFFIAKEEYDLLKEMLNNG